jgi:CRISPR-associated protein Csd1
MIKKLSDLGKMLRSQKVENELIHDALKEEPISIEVLISADGCFQGFQPFEKRLTVAEALTSKKGKARLLLDKAEEVICYGKEARKKHALFLNKLRKYRKLPEVAPVLAFFITNKKNGVTKALETFESSIQDEKKRKGNMGFRISAEGCRIHEKRGILEEIIAQYETSQNNLKAKSQKRCSVCGQAKYPVEDVPHGMIRNVPKGRTSGCALVSYNEHAFESYKLKGNLNSSICTHCATTYVEGLNWLLSDGTKIKNKKNKDDILYSHRWPRKRSESYSVDTSMVFWTRSNIELPEIDQLETPNPDDVARLIEAVTSGAANDSRYLEPEQFYSFTLSGSAARIAVRDWIETSLFDLRKSIAKWFQDIAIEEYDKDLKKMKIRYARLYVLARSCQRHNSDGGYDKDDTSPARVAACLWNAALKNTTLPLWILTRVLQRARLDKHGITPDRAALIKLILNRNNKRGGFIIMEKMNDAPKPVAYVCGQIFAKLESIQYAALGDRNAGIRERYFTYAMMSPSSAFGRLFNLNSKHFTKLKNDKPGLAINLDKQLQELCKAVDINAFPAMFTLEQQGQFAIGYYHQRESQFNSLSKN